VFSTQPFVLKKQMVSFKNPSSSKNLLFYLYSLTNSFSGLNFLDRCWLPLLRFPPIAVPKILALASNTFYVPVKASGLNLLLAEGLIPSLKQGNLI